MRDRCAAKVKAIGRGFHRITWQCSRKNGHGPEGLFCKQHAELMIDIAGDRK